MVKPWDDEKNAVGLPDGIGRKKKKPRFKEVRLQVNRKFCPQLRHGPGQGALRPQIVDRIRQLLDVSRRV